MISDPAMVKALLTAVAIAVVGGPLGCLVVWNRLAYFGDSLAHSSMLGIALGIFLGISMNISIFIICILFAISFMLLKKNRVLPSDTILGILAHASLSAGIIIISLMNMPPVDLHDFLFGDIMAVTTTDIYSIAGCAFISLMFLYKIWDNLILASINDDLANVEEVNNDIIQILFILLLTIMVAISIRTVGVILITSLLIIPAAAGRLFSRTPEQMAVMAVFFGMVSSITGIVVAFSYDIPSGPSVVFTASIIFLIITLLSALVNKRD